MRRGRLHVGCHTPRRHSGSGASVHAAQEKRTGDALFPSPVQLLLARGTLWDRRYKVSYRRLQRSDAAFAERLDDPLPLRPSSWN